MPKYTLHGMAPTNIETVHQTSLLYIEVNPDRLGLLSPTQDQRSQQQSGQITLQLVLDRQAQVPQGHTSCRNKLEIRETIVPRSMAVEALRR